MGLYFINEKIVIIAKLIETNYQLVLWCCSVVWFNMADEACNGGKSHLHILNTGGGSIDHPYCTSLHSCITTIHSLCMGGLLRDKRTLHTSLYLALTYIGWHRTRLMNATAKRLLYSMVKMHTVHVQPIHVYPCVHFYILDLILTKKYFG